VAVDLSKLQWPRCERKKGFDELNEVALSRARPEAGGAGACTARAHAVGIDAIMT